MFPQDRKALREMYFNAWQKHQNKQMLQPLEQQIVAVIQEHPEYQKAFDNPDKFVDKDYFFEMGETNPFLHMGLHLGLREQIATNRPTGIDEIYQQLCKTMSPHDAEHQMMQCLAETLFQAQQNALPPNDDQYLENLRCLLQ